MRRRWTMLLMSMLMLLVTSLEAAAAETVSFLEGAMAEEDQLQVICSDISREEERREQFKVSLGGQEVPVSSLKTVTENQVPATYYCLVDVSGSMNTAQISQAKEVLTALCDGMQNGDNMVIGTLGNQTSSTEVLSEKEEIAGVIAGLEAGREDTNLYAGIVEGIRLLQTDSRVNPRRCLVVLSDGQDDQKTGITKEEADVVVTEASIPVYTVATLRNSPGDSQLEYAKRLGSFARMSTGGVHYAPVLEGRSGSEVGAAVLASMGNGMILTADLAGIQAVNTKDVWLLRVIYTSDAGTSYEDSMELYAEDVGLMRPDEEETTIQETVIQEAALQETTTAVAETSMESPAGPDPVEPEEEGISAVLWVVAGVVLAAVLAAVFLRKKAKDAVASQDAAACQDDVEAEGDGSPIGSAQVQGAFESGGTAQPLSGPKPRGRYKLRLYAIGYGDIKHVLRLEEGKDTTIGRTDKADIILDSSDKKLSAVHCKVRWEDGKLYVWDMNSSNGTFVNGVPIKDFGRVLVRDGETIRMGSYEYRIGHPGEEK